MPSLRYPSGVPAEAEGRSHPEQPGKHLARGCAARSRSFPTFNESISFQVNCETQQEIDHYWEKLGESGDPRAQQCGWLKDRYGVSWQVVPTMLPELLDGPDREASERAMSALLAMKKLDIAALRAAYAG